MPQKVFYSDEEKRKEQLKQKQRGRGAYVSRVVKSSSTRNIGGKSRIKERRIRNYGSNDQFSSEGSTTSSESDSLERRIFSPLKTPRDSDSFPRKIQIRSLTIRRNDNYFISLGHSHPSSRFTLEERVSNFYKILQNTFRSSVSPLHEATVHAIYIRHFTERYFHEVKQKLVMNKKWMYSERARVYFDFMIDGMEMAARRKNQQNNTKGTNRTEVEVLEGDYIAYDGYHSQVISFKIRNQSLETIQVNLPIIHAVTGGTGLQSTVLNQELYPLTLKGKNAIEVQIFCTASVIGVFPGEILFSFINLSTKEQLEMKRSIIYRRQNQTLREFLRPTAPYQQRLRPQYNITASSRQQEHQTLKLFGTKPNSGSKTFQYDLEEFPIPEHYKDIKLIPQAEIYLKESYQELINAPTTFLAADDADAVHPASFVNLLSMYTQHYQSMLYFEEIGLQSELDHYSSENISFEKQDDYYWLEVPGLAEKRPSVLRGDEVEVIHFSHFHGTTRELKYYGYVWKVEQTRIQIHFHPNFAVNYSSDSRYTVRYLLKRTNMKIMHDTMKRISCCQDSMSQDRIRSILFPVGSSNTVMAASDAPVAGGDIATTIAINKSSMIPNYFPLNTMQRLAVQMIVSKPKDIQSTSPFILFGPPGTGKTHTLVNAIKQLMSERPNSKLLILAPSNQAADLLIDKLSSDFNPSIMFRLMSFQRSNKEVSETVLRYCSEDFRFPAISELKSYSLLVSTCSMSSKLFYYGFPADYFDTIIIDESGHCWEPEALAAFMNFYSTPTTTGSSSACVSSVLSSAVLTPPRLVLAGDPKQLGPVVRSNQGKSFGLELSLLERLIQQFPIYQRDLTTFSETSGYNPKYIVQLNECYRCHPAIIELPNQFFYHNSLKSSAHPSTINTFLGWDKLPNRSMPIIFHGCVGENEQESNSPSWFNTMECEIILSYIQQLQEVEGFDLKDIGIITPYHKQVQKIRKAITTLNLPVSDEKSSIKIGSCEQFQGQERKVIIISTVRSSVELFESDDYFNIGFVKNPKRFNVAITRAQALLIVIGNPKTLNHDPHWGSLLWHCVDHGCYVGCDPPIERQKYSLPSVSAEAVEEMKVE